MKREKEFIGRVEEQKTLKDFYESNRGEFLAIYGRRRVGKTFLIKSYFSKKASLFFYVTGINEGLLFEQIRLFTQEISRCFYGGAELKEKNSWLETFEFLNQTINKFLKTNQKIVLFFDEFPWMVTPKSRVLQTLEYYWNRHWVDNSRIKLIICGSSASWIINNIINNRGGLHNRITKQIKLQPFNLTDTKNYLLSNNIKLRNKHIVNVYMLTGGIPYYLSYIRTGQSAMQIIEELAFKQGAPLLKEFDNLFSSLFSNPEIYIEIIKEIATHHYGIEQTKLLKVLKVRSGGRITAKLGELEEAGFIMSFLPHGNSKKGVYYKVIDPYTLFYFHWIKKTQNTLQAQALTSYWESLQNTPSWYSWSGYAFEIICYTHLSEIKKALKIKTGALMYSWRDTAKKIDSHSGAQIDLLFDRQDDAITICEIKYTNQPFAIDKQYAKNLLNKVEVYKKITKTKKQLFIAMISASGLKETMYSEEMISATVTLDDLFMK